MNNVIRGEKSLFILRRIKITHSELVTYTLVISVRNITPGSVRIQGDHYPYNIRFHFIKRNPLSYG